MALIQSTPRDDGANGAHAKDLPRDDTANGSATRIP